MDEDFIGADYYDWGYRRGVFDKCNGQPMRDMKAWHIMAEDGYRDAYENNERRI